MARKDNSKLKELIAEYGIKDLNDVHEFVKMLTAETMVAHKFLCKLQNQENDIY